MAAVESTFACVLAAVGQDPDAGWIVTVAAEEIGLVPPPLPVLPGTLGTGVEGGLETVTVALPAALMLAAGIVAVICVAVIVATVEV